MKNYYFIFTLLSFLSLSVYGQERINIERYRSLANEYFYDGEYDEALKLFEKIDSVVPNNRDFLYKIGLSHLNGDFKTKSLHYLEQAKELGIQDTSALFFLAKSYHLNHDFDKAIEAYNDYLKVSPKNPSLVADATRFIQQCFVGKKYFADSLQIIVTHLNDKINSRFADYTPLISSNDSQMIFTSQRENTNGGVDEKKKFFADIYSAQKQGEMWGTPTLLSSVNTNKHDVCVGLSIDGNQLILRRNNTLYLSKKENSQWSEAVAFGPTINDNTISNACFSPDNQTLYFISSRAGGIGGKDIYRSSLQEDGSWGNVQNLGESVNTPYDEESPFIHADGHTLFFSSKGHDVIGGYDVFSSLFDDNTGKWTNARNMGYPINTADDDLDFVWSTNGTKGYYTSTKKDTYGNSDLYMLVGPVQSNEVLIQFSLFDFLSKEKVTTATVSLLTVPEQKIVIRTQAYSGIFKTGVIKGNSYKYIIEADGYVLREGTFDTPIQTVYSEIHRNFFLKSFNDTPTKPKEEIPDENLVTTTTTTTVNENPSDNNETAVTTTTVNENPSDNNETAVTTTTVNENPSDNNETAVTTTTVNENPSDNNETTVTTTTVNDNSTNESNNSVVTTRTNENSTTARTNETTANNNQPIKPSDLQTNQIFEEGSKIIFRNILFAFDKSKITKSSTTDLDKFYQLMKKHPALLVEVSGHTDNIGKKKYNLRLSKRRAKVVVKYLVKKGISKKQFVAIGYGDSQAFASNDTESGRQLNRRTEFKVLKIDNDVKYNTINKVDLSNIETWNEQEEQTNLVTYDTPSPSISNSTVGNTVIGNTVIGEILPIKVNFMFDVYDELTPYSQGKLDVLVEQMNQKQTMRLRIHAHTDAAGDHTYNEGLSTRRAQTVITYLTSKGIDASRFEIASHGATKLLEKTEGDNLENRRVEFEVLEK